jgi:hypothetical protein
MNSCILKYFKAWKCQDSTLCNEIFAVNAKYIVKPCEEEYNGIDKIIEYWNMNPVMQKNPSPIITEYFSNDDKTMWFCEFENKYNFDEKQIKITKGMILFIIDPKTNKINELREFYRSRIVTIDKSN